MGLLLIALLCSVVGLLGYLWHLHRLRKVADPYRGLRVRVRFPRRVFRELRQAAGSEYAADVMLLMEMLLRLRRRTALLPLLPANTDGQPRMMALARKLCTDHACLPEEMSDALMALSPPPAPCETAALPVCLCVAQAERIEETLREMAASPSRQVALADDVRQAALALRALDIPSAATLLEGIDPVHALLMADPGKVYPRMDAPSRLMMRRRMEQVCRRTRMAAEDVLHTAVSLCRDADPQSVEASLPYWLLDGAGLRSLQHKLPTRRGWLWVHWVSRPHAVQYGTLLAWALLTGFLFLQCRQPVVLAPCFALLMGQLMRSWTKPFSGAHLPAVQETPKGMRILAVLTAELTDEHAAIHAVRRLKTLRCTFPENVDLLLLADFPGHMSGMGAAAQGIMMAASSAVMALGGMDGRVMYLQRAQAQGGPQGAITCACRLVAAGDCEDVLLCATVEPAILQGRYAFVLAVPEDASPAPGVLERLTAALCHPLNTHYPTPEGHRGFSCAAPAENDRLRLLAPGAYLEHVDGLLPPDHGASALADALSGCVFLAGNSMPAAVPATLTGLLDSTLAAAYDAGTTLRWQMPLVQTPSGFVKNPLSFLARWRLREGVKDALLPASTLLVLLWALLTGAWQLALLTVLLGAWDGLLNGDRTSLRQALCRIMLLPTRAVSGVLGLWLGAAKQEAAPIPWPSWCMWAQGVTAAVVAGGVFMSPLPVAAVITAAAFGAFPWAFRLYETPLKSTAPLTEAHTALLTEALHATWRFFAAHTGPDGLMPDTVQVSPAVGADATTTPRAIAGSLLAVVSAKEAGLIAADEAASRLLSAAQALAELPLPFGLPCQRYDLRSRTVLDPRTDAAETGLLLSSIMVAAQSVRSWLNELPPALCGTSAALMATADRMDLHRLYDGSSGLLFSGLDETGQPLTPIPLLADGALLLSAAGCARGVYPPEHLRRLRDIRVRLHGLLLPLTRHGAAADGLLANLFLPELPWSRMLLRGMQHEQQRGLWGQSDCLHEPYDTALRYRQGIFGMPQTALALPSAAPVYTPVAAALALSVDAHAASDALSAFKDQGCLGALGFYDSIDTASGEVTAAYSTWHQGLMMAALCDVLAFSPIRSTFCSLPEVEAMLPLLLPAASPMKLPALPLRTADAPIPPLMPRQADTALLPPESHVLGDQTFRILADAQGSMEGWAEDRCLVQEMRLYLSDGGRVYMLGDTHALPEVTFGPEGVHVTQVCGSLKAESTLTVDAVQHRAIHLLRVTNLSTRDRCIEVASAVIPGLSSSGTVETAQPSSGVLLAVSRVDGTQLCHSIHAPAALARTAMTDHLAFLGRGRTMASPASLEEPMADLVIPAEDVCLSHRVRLSLGGRGQAVLCFATGTAILDVPTADELPGLMRLCGMQQQAMAEAAGLTRDTALYASMLLGIVRVRPAIAAQGSARDALDAIAGWYALHGLPLALDLHDPGVPVLTDELPLPGQIAALYARNPAPPEELRRPTPGRMPDVPLLHRNGYGGFDPKTDDCLVLLSPGQTTPAPWTNRHISGTAVETVDESGMGLADITLTLADGTHLSPWDLHLPRMVRFGPGLTVWHAFAKEAEITLHAAGLPGKARFLRVLRVHTEVEGPMTVQLGGISRALPTDAGGHGELAWTQDAQGRIDWAEDIAATDVLRQIRSYWTERLDTLSFSTPDPTFDLLMGRILPQQVLTSPTADGMGLAPLHPWAALRRLLHSARTAHSIHDWLAVAMMLSACQERCGQGVCDVRLPGQHDTLLDSCRRAALALPEDASVSLRLTHALICRILTDIRPDEQLDEMRRRLLNAVDGKSWRGTHYGDRPLDLMVQCLASAAYDADTRTQRSLRTAWDTFWDAEHQLLRQGLPSDAPPLPGLPANGGMDMSAAVWALGALLKQGMTEEAFLLLSAMSPIRRTDGLAAVEVYCGAPQLLAGGLCCPPMTPGRAIRAGGDEAAGMLYHFLLTEVIGLHRTGNRVRIAPHVPAAWPDFALTLREGTAIWHIQVERRCTELIVDGLKAEGSSFLVTDDGRVHQVHVPLA